MNVTSAVPLLSAKQLNYLSNTPFYFTGKADIFSFISDHYLSLAAPFVAYWVLSLVFHVLDVSESKWLEPYRLHESAEVKARNLVSRTDVVKAVIFQQFIQTVVGLWWISDNEIGVGVDHVKTMLDLLPTLTRLLQGVVGESAAKQILGDHGHVLLYTAYWWIAPAARFLFGIFVIDTWQYFLHRAMHNNTFLYKTLHSVHHRLYVPYAFGALYNHPLEGFLLDTLGAGLAEYLAGMTTREAMLLFTISTMKTVDDHCGYKLPFDPLQILFANNADYHDIHHQIIGIKSNFSQPFFIHWDVILGTRMTRKDIESRKKKAATKTE